MGGLEDKDGRPAERGAACPGNRHACPLPACRLSSPLSVPSSLSSPGDDLGHGFLSPCTKIDWERRPTPPCALWAVEIVSISYFLWLDCVEFDFSLSILVLEMKG